MGAMTWEQACRRAGGRRRYNSWRQFMATYRRYEVARLLLAGTGTRHGQGLLSGQQAAIARQLGVSPSTISRDVAALQRQRLDGGLCPVCGHEAHGRLILRGASSAGVRQKKQARIAVHVSAGTVALGSGVTCMGAEYVVALRRRFRL